MKKIQKTLIVIGALCILYGIGVVAIIGVTHWFDLFGIIAGIGIAGIGFTMPFFKSLPRLLRYLFILILITVLSGFIFTEMQIAIQGQRAPEPGAAYVIVLGAKVDGTEPSISLSRRIKAAAVYMLENPLSVAVATGGRGVGESITEAQAIATGLEELGIDLSRIKEEGQSTSTKENLLYGLDVIEENGGNTRSKVVIISSEYHVFRAKKLAEAIGYKNISTKGCSSMLYLTPQYYAREFAALVKEKKDGNI